MVNECSLLLNTRGWIERENSIKSAVLFGSHARCAGHVASADELSDIDLHLVVKPRRALEAVDWAAVFKGFNLLMVTNRTAIGGARKLTLTAREGQIDLVVIWLPLMQIARLGVAIGWHKRNGLLANALNNMATIMSGGYLFIKGEQEWGSFYARVVNEMPGVRISDVEAAVMANHFICDFLHFQKRVRRGEHIAAQRMLHLTLAEKNISLLHELRLRRGQLTFQQARRLELLSNTAELDVVRVNACLSEKDLFDAGAKLVAGLLALMEALVPDWKPPVGVQQHLTPAPRITLR